MRVKIEINGQTLEAENGAMLIEIADQHGISIPRFCYHKNLSIAANCRMCLVEVEGAPKPVPACATPITDGMKVFTQSSKALSAQKAVMEFLLINHPLDCPICDQGGECDLQDFSLGYGVGASQYHEIKRVVRDKDIGPLIATEMTRCIHCTRCVRFGQEIAGVREMGATGRGDHTEIGTYIEKSVDSELSGNIIDLCPVGALTSKPFRFSARAWEMQSTESVSAHDCVGSNLTFHTLRGAIKRTIARENPQINDTWISDRDRFAYLGLEHEDRLGSPMIKQNGKWQNCSWEDALHFAADQIKEIIAKTDASQLGVLLSPSATVEECYLAQQLARGIGSANIDHRLYQSDYLTQEHEPDYLGLGMLPAELAGQQAFFLICANVRKEQPIIAHQIRKAQQNKDEAQAARVSQLHFMACDPVFTVEEDRICPASKLAMELKAITSALIEKQKIKDIDTDLSNLLKSVTIEEAHQRIVDDLLAKDKSVVLLGSSAQTLPDYSLIRMLASFIAEHSGSALSHLTTGANSSGAYLAGAVPHRLAGAKAVSKPGLGVQQMLDESLKAFIVHNIEPEFDMENPDKALSVLKSAFSVAITPYASDATKDWADVLLPAAVYTESSGTFVNIAGQWQSFQAVAAPYQQARPAWKILRVLGNLFAVKDMDYMASSDVLDVVREQLGSREFNSGLMRWHTPQDFVHTKEGIMRVATLPLYAVDSMVRRAGALQQTQDAQAAKKVRIHSSLARELGVADGDQVMLKQNENSCHVRVSIDDRIAPQCVYLANGIDLASSMGCSFSNVEIIKK